MKNITSVFIAAWYPHKEKHHFGIFIKEHAKAASLFANVTVIYLQFFKRGKIPSIQLKQEKKDSVEVYHLIVSSPIRKFGMHDFLVKKAYKKALLQIKKTQPIDIIHVNVRDKYTKLITEINFIKTTPKIVSEHFSFYHTGIKLLPKIEQERETTEISDWFSDPSIKSILPVSKQLGKVLVDNFSVDKNKVKIIPNVASEEFYYTQKEKEGTIKIALVANWQAPKNPLLFLETLLLLKDELTSKLSIDWIGQGEQMIEITEFTKKNLKEYDIKFWGLQEKKKIGNTLRATDFIVHPTDAENLPTIIIESLCCGTPVLTHDVNGIPELINETNGIMCKPKSVSDLSSQLKRMIETCRCYDNELISKNAVALFSEQAISKQIKAVYTEILS